MRTSSMPPPTSSRPPATSWPKRCTRLRQIGSEGNRNGPRRYEESHDGKRCGQAQCRHRQAHGRQPQAGRSDVQGFVRSEAKEIETALEDTKKAMTENDADKLNAATDKLTAASHKLAEAMYKASSDRKRRKSKRPSKIRRKP